MAQVYNYKGEEIGPTCRQDAYDRGFQDGINFVWNQIHDYCASAPRDDYYQTDLNAPTHETQK